MKELLFNGGEYYIQAYQFGQYWLIQLVYREEQLSFSIPIPNLTLKEVSELYNLLNQKQQKE